MHSTRRVMQPGFEAMWDRQVFHPWFLKSLERYSVRACHREPAACHMRA